MRPASGTTNQFSIAAWRGREGLQQHDCATGSSTAHAQTCKHAVVNPKTNDVCQSHLLPNRQMSASGALSAALHFVRDGALLAVAYGHLVLHMHAAHQH